MHKNFDITLDSITKIEGNAQLDVKVENDKISYVKFIIGDYRRFYTEAVRGKPYMAVPSLLSRICGTCSIAHLMASIRALENALEITDQITTQTRLLRKLTLNGMMIRDHALHLYIFSLPDLLGIDSVLEINEENTEHHQLLHDAFDLKAVGNKLSTVFAGAAVHAPFPIVGGFTKLPEKKDYDGLVDELKASREKILRGIKVFWDWKIDLIRNTDYIALVSDDYSFTEGTLMTSNGTTIDPKDYKTFLDEIVIPYSQSKGYLLKNDHEDYLVGALARMNLNAKNLHPHTLKDAGEYLTFFPSNNVYDNCLAQAIEILHCIDQSIDILNELDLQSEAPIKPTPKAGVGVGVIEAPRGTLYHLVETDDKGIIVNCDVMVPTSQNQINIENDLRQFFEAEYKKREKKDLQIGAETIIRAYDPCMSCATNFLKVRYIT